LRALLHEPERAVRTRVPVVALASLRTVARSECTGATLGRPLVDDVDAAPEAVVKLVTAIDTTTTAIANKTSMPTRIRVPPYSLCAEPVDARTEGDQKPLPGCR